MVDMLMVRAEAPPTLATMSRKARPMVALARHLGPKAPRPQLMSRAARAGPLTMKRGEWKFVVAETPWRSKASSLMASTPAMSSAAARPEPATMASTRSRVGGTTGRPSVTPRSKSVSKGSGAGVLTARSGLAQPEVRVVALRGRPRIVGVRQDRDARGLRDVRIIEVFLVVLEDVDALLRPLALQGRSAPDDPGLGQPRA